MDESLGSTVAEHINVIFERSKFWDKSEIASHTLLALSSRTKYFGTIPSWSSDEIELPPAMIGWNDWSNFFRRSKFSSKLVPLPVTKAVDSYWARSDTRFRQ